jgi:putative oxidoreductase
VAPLLILRGLWTRSAAVLHAVTILFAAILVHADPFMRLALTRAWAAETYVFYILGAAAAALLGAGSYLMRGGHSRWD